MNNNNNNNIKDYLWEDGVTTVREYLLRRWFYGSLSKLCEAPHDSIEFKEDLLRRVESTSHSTPVYEYYGGRSGTTTPDSFGWKCNYDEDMVDYLDNGVASFEIYDK